MTHTIRALPASWHRPLLLMSLLMAGLALVAAAGLAVDDRMLLTESVWAKPLKFAVSFTIFGLTLAALIPRLTRFRRTLWWLGTVFAATGVVDVGFIALQAARGTFSHFNTDSDPINAIGQQIFSSGVIGLFGATIVIAVLILLQRVGDAALTRALRAGLLLVTAGMAVAFGIAGGGGSRTVPDANGRPVTLSGAHGVGVPDGGGMPVTNWSTTGGDLRVPHFVGLHAIQVLVLFVLLLGFLAGRVLWLRDERVRVRLTGVAVLGCSGVFAITTWQAVRGQSLVDPDGLTLLAVAALVAVCAVWAVGTVVAARRRSALTRSGDRSDAPAPAWPAPGGG
ncbi:MULTISPECIES: hypothetical protein [Pseudonocardia]|uniref:Uncharacterized protein n=2 Tax=Pseudonocardia TaxID=1847 RepID=A0A1Y2MQT0_PSEAH|nr:MULTISPECIES: hypothetical protein [Pseudonocardia]OSY37585.1 hypothetical protein BG845_04622 [Pseudonocardia autotrophica]TDN73707.1 hypothetical protein C8E95_2811 [Pseudonocardia autotrophica]BBG04450.1 hypothetical protein Pdca_56590 [Pseudonocardia autotrophica]GEC27304.1 hypothetical protein PSA01_43330 [Pseudonocardia saturnea]